MYKTLGDKILEELEKNLIKNSLLIFDFAYERPERVEVFTLDPRNILILWKGFNDKPPEALIKAESEEKVEELLDKVEGIYCSFLIPQELSAPIERRYDMTRENFLLYTIKDEGSFKKFTKHGDIIERLEPKLKYARQIVREWKYSNDVDLIFEKLKKYPFFGIREEDELISYAGTIAQTEEVSFLALAYTKLNYRGLNYRGKGMCKSVSSALVEDVFKQGRIPAMYIVDENTPSIRVAERLGFCPIAAHVRFSPKRRIK